MYSSSSAMHAGGSGALPIPGTAPSVVGFAYAPRTISDLSSNVMSPMHGTSGRSWKSIAAFVAIAFTVVLVIALAYVYRRKKRLTAARKSLREAFGIEVPSTEATSSSSSVANDSTAVIGGEEHTVVGSQHPTSNVGIETAKQPWDAEMMVAQKQTNVSATGDGGSGSERSHENLSIRRTRQVAEVTATDEQQLQQQKLLEWERAEREALRHEQNRLRGLKRQLIARKAEVKERGGFRVAFGQDETAKHRWHDEQSRLLRELTDGRREYKRRSVALQQRRHQRRKRHDQVSGDGGERRPQRRLRRSRRSAAAMSETSDYSSGLDDDDDDDDDDNDGLNDSLRDDGTLSLNDDDDHDHDTWNDVEQSERQRVNGVGRRRRRCRRNDDRRALTLSNEPGTNVTNPVGQQSSSSTSTSNKRERERQLLRNALSPLIAAPLTEQTVAENARLGVGGYEEVAGMTTASLELEEPYTRHLDLRAARLAVYEKQTSDEPLPTDLQRYKLMGAGKDTGVHAKWPKNERALLAMLAMLSQGLRHAYRYPQERLAVTVTEDFVARFKHLYESSTATSSSSSGNGHDMSSVIVSRLPTHVTAQLLDTLAMYLLLPPRYTDRDSVRTASDLALAVAVTPTQYRYPTVRLSDAEAVRSLAAWLLATYRRHGGTFDAQADASTDGVGLLADARFPLRQNEFEPGLHLDGGYFARSRAPSFEMLRAAADPQLEYTFHLIRAEANPRVIWERVHRIASHRTIAVGLCGFNVPVQLAQPCNRLTLTNANSSNGIEVIPSCRYLRFFTPTMQFAVCGQAAGKAYYDATLMDRRAPQYAVQYRNVHYSDSPSKFAYPANGLLNRLTDKELINHDGRALDTVEYPTEAVSFVAKWERYGVLYQAYRVEKLAPADVREIVLVDSQDERITIIAEITNLSPEETLVYHFTERHRIEPGAKRCFKTQFEMTPNGREMTCTTGDSDFPGFPLRVDERFTVHVFHGPENGPLGDAVLMVDQQPRVCAPLSRPIEKAIVEVPMEDGRLATFAHHPAENQWLFTSYV